MLDKRISIEKVKELIANKTKAEKIKAINGYYEQYWDFKKDAQDEIWKVYQNNFEEDLLALKEQIADDDSIAYNYDWNWFFNADNIRNQDAVFDTKDFIETKRKDVFDSLYFFNLLFKQIDELKDNLDKPFDYVNSLKALPLKEDQRHILLGMLLFWHGGYPVENMDPKYKTILRLIEGEFLSMFPNKATPEKEFCKVKPNYIDKKEAFIIRANQAIAASFEQKSKPEPDTEHETNQIELNGFTNSQLVLIFYYFFKSNGLTPRESIDIAPIAKFIHLITGKKFTNTNNSGFYDKLKTVPNFKTDNELIKDLEKIKPFFEKVELNEIVKMIDSEIDIARNQVKQQRKYRK